MDCVQKYIKKKVKINKHTKYIHTEENLFECMNKMMKSIKSFRKQGGVFVKEIQNWLSWC